MSLALGEGLRRLREAPQNAVGRPALSIPSACAVAATYHKAEGNDTTSAEPVVDGHRRREVRGAKKQCRQP